MYSLYTHAVLQIREIFEIFSYFIVGNMIIQISKIPTCIKGNEGKIIVNVCPTMKITLYL